jgi:hypothetical protein
MKEQASIMLKSGFLPAHLKSAEQVIAVMLAGRDLKIPPSTAIRNLFVVQGKVSMSADLMLALAYSRIPGFLFSVDESTPEKAVVSSKRPGGKTVVTTFTIKDAAMADLTRGDNWRKYPAQMLLARAKSGNLRITAADALCGIYTPGELGGEEIINNETVVKATITGAGANEESIIDATDFKEVTEGE